MADSLQRMYARFDDCELRALGLLAIATHRPTKTADKTDLLNHKKAAFTAFFIPN